MPSDVSMKISKAYYEGTLKLHPPIVNILAEHLDSMGVGDAFEACQSLSIRSDVRIPEALEALHRELEKKFRGSKQMNWKTEPRSYCTAIVEVDGGDITTVAEFSDRGDAELCLKCIKAVRTMWNDLSPIGPPPF